jgi:MFS family permease
VNTPVARKQGRVGFAILVAALGYFVDIYDLVLFGIVRVESLRDIGIPQAELLGTGLLLLNMQMAGMLLGGILWGVLGDKRGRLSVLFGSIFLYSTANALNGLVDSVWAYAVLRLLAGIGLAGELGAGVTLVSEIMSNERRGYGTMIVAAVGLCGAIAAGLVGDLLDWRTAYYVGGAMGFALLALRVGVHESGLFRQVVETSSVDRGDFFGLIRSPRLRWRYLNTILIGLPIWYVVGILVTFSPEFGVAMGMAQPPEAGRAIMFTYAGAALGDFLSGLLSQIFRTRRKIVLAFLVGTGLLICGYFAFAHVSLTVFYAICLALGTGAGYWAVFVTMAAEQFGTNIRATVATTAPNFVRGALVPITSVFQIGRQYFGVLGSGFLVGILTVTIALLALRKLEETFGKDLDFLD